jgi:hypothetical protein
MFASYVHYVYYGLLCYFKGLEHIIMQMTFTFFIDPHLIIFSMSKQFWTSSTNTNCRPKLRSHSLAKIMSSTWVL